MSLCKVVGDKSRLAVVGLVSSFLEVVYRGRQFRGGWCCAFFFSFMIIVSQDCNLILFSYCINMKLAFPGVWFI
jgi:hypothetical protein